MERPLVAILGNLAHGAPPGGRFRQLFFLTRFIRREFEGLRVPRGGDGVHGGGFHQVGVVVPDEVGHVAQIIQKQYKKKSSSQPSRKSLSDPLHEDSPGPQGRVQ